MSSKIEAIAECHSPMATIFEFICYHMHVAGWLRKWPKWAIGSTSAASSGAWRPEKSRQRADPMISVHFRKKRYRIHCLENIRSASTCSSSIYTRHDITGKCRSSIDSQLLTPILVIAHITKFGNQMSTMIFTFWYMNIHKLDWNSDL